MACEGRASCRLIFRVLIFRGWGSLQPPIHPPCLCHYRVSKHVQRLHSDYVLFDLVCLMKIKYSPEHCFFFYVQNSFVDFLDTKSQFNYRSLDLRKAWWHCRLHLRRSSVCCSGSRDATLHFAHSVVLCVHIRQVGTLSFCSLGMHTIWVCEVASSRSTFPPCQHGEHARRHKVCQPVVVGCVFSLLPLLQARERLGIRHCQWNRQPVPGVLIMLLSSKCI